MKWTEIYMPKKWDDIGIHENTKKEMDDWILDLQNKKTNTFFLYLCGPAGSGKTTMNRLLLEKYGYDIIEWNAIDLKQSKQLEDILYKMIYKQNINILIQEKMTITGILLEECDCLQNIGKDTLTKITENMKNLDNPIPILCTSNELECDNIKNGKVVFVEPVGRDYIISLIHKIMKNENWLLREDVLNYLLDKMDTDMRCWLIQLEYIYIYFKNKGSQNEITLDMIIRYMETTQKKNNDYTLYQWTERVFQGNLSTTDIYSLCDNDTLLLPMMVYSNIDINVNVFYKQKFEISDTSSVSKFEIENNNFLMNKNIISDIYTTQEIFREYSKKTNNMEMYGHNVFYSLTYISHLSKLNIIKCDVNNVDIIFPTNIYNKKYTECTHRKHINNMMAEYNISRVTLNYWSYTLYWLYMNMNDTTEKKTLTKSIKSKSKSKKTVSENSEKSENCLDLNEKNQLDEDNVNMDTLTFYLNHYNKYFNYKINNENLNDVFKCDYLRDELKKRKKENILKVLYKLLEIDVKKTDVKKKRGRPKKNM